MSTKDAPMAPNIRGTMPRIVKIFFCISLLGMKTSELLRKRRGRPKAIKQRAVQQTWEEKFKAITERSNGTPAVYASTTKGGMKLIYEGHHFRYSYRKGQYSIFQCCYKENKEECKVRVLSDQKRVYPLEGEHVHFVQATDKSVTDVTFEPAALQDEQEVTYIEMPAAEATKQQHLSIAMPESNAQNTDNYEIYETTYLRTIEETEENTLQSKEVIKNTMDEVNDPNDLREKIKQRLQKVLMSKKK